MIYISKTRYDEWYFYESFEKFLQEIDFVYDTYISKIKDIYNKPEKEAEDYVKYLEQNPSCLISEEIDDAMLEIEGKGQERYYFVLNMKYRNLAVYIDMIYQMLEQFIISICRFQQKFHSYDQEINKMKFRSLDSCNKMFLEYGFDFSSYKEYEKINELRLLQNVLKHSEGNSKDDLIKIRPDFFVKTDVFTIYDNTLIDATLNVTDNDLKEYVLAIKKFIRIFPNKLKHGYNAK